jgi:hypothetical protein
LRLRRSYRSPILIYFSLIPVEQTSIPYTGGIEETHHPPKGLEAQRIKASEAWNRYDYRYSSSSMKDVARICHRAVLAGT